MAELPGITDTLAPIGMGGQGLVAIPLSAAQISSPTSIILGNLGATYYLNVYPFTHYRSDGAQLVADFGVTLGTVNTLVSQGVNTAQNRAMQYGNMPAGNAVVETGPYANLTVTQALNAINLALVQAGASAPANAVQPAAATGTATVGSLQTGATGTWTGASTYLYQWYRQDATTGARTLITGAVSSTYTAQSVDYGYKLIYAVAGVSGTPGIPPSAYIFAAAATATIGSTLATNAGAVSAITGSAPAGSTLSLAMGGWTGATNGWSAQWYVAGIASGAPTAISLTTPITFVTDATMVGKVVSAVVYGYNAFNVPSAAPGITATGSITVTGVTPPVTNTTPPVWANPLQLEVQNDFSDGVYSGSVNTIIWDFYRNGTAAANLVRAGNTISKYTPHASEGVIIGDTLYIIENAIVTATGASLQTVSVGKVVAATPATLTAATANTGLVWTVSATITAVIPVTATGGTTPYTFSISPALPTGLTMSPSTGQITGTSSTTSSSNTYTVTVTDAASATSQATFTAQVNSASVTPLNSPAASDNNNLLAYGSDVTYTSQTITGGDGVVRFQPISNILGTGQSGTLHRIKFGDPVTSGSGMRAELGGASANSSIVAGGEYWWAFAMYVLPNEWHNNEASTSDQVIMQIHQVNPVATPGPTFGFLTQGTNNRIAFSRVYGTVAAGTAVNGTEVYPAFTGAANSRPPDGVWTRFILHIKMGYDTSFAPVIQLWRNEVLICDLSGSSALIGTQNETFYFRHGFYKWNYGSSGLWGANTSRAAYYSGLYFQQGAGLYANAAVAIAAFQ